MKKTITFMLALVLIFVFSACTNGSIASSNNKKDAGGQISEERKEVLLKADDLLFIAKEGSKESTNTVYDAFMEQTMDSASLEDIALQTSELHESYETTIDGIDTNEYPELYLYKNAVRTYVANNRAISLNVSLYCQRGNVDYMQSAIEFRKQEEDLYDLVVLSRHDFLFEIGFTEDEINEMINNNEITQ